MWAIPVSGWIIDGSLPSTSNWQLQYGRFVDIADFPCLDVEWNGKIQDYNRK